MKAADLKAVERALVRMRSSGVDARTVTVFSPYADLAGDGTMTERTAVESVWPRASIQELDRCQWDLDLPAPSEVRQADIGIICNTFMCSSNPTLWFRHLSERVTLLVVQDQAVAMRENGRHCSVETGDVMRYSVSSHGILGQTDPGLEVFDLSAAGYELLAAESYEDDGSLKFVAVLRLR